MSKTKCAYCGGEVVEKRGFILMDTKRKVTYWECESCGVAHHHACEVIAGGVCIDCNHCINCYGHVLNDEREKFFMEKVNQKKKELKENKL